MPGPESTAAAFHRACEAAGIRYVVVGGLAVGAWGIPRATADVDTIVVLDPPRLSAFASALRAEGLEFDERDLTDALTDGAHVSIFDPRTLFHVDIKPARSAAEREQAEFAIVLTTTMGPLRVATAEHTVAYKLLYGSPQDLADARSILIRQAGRLDIPRLRALADALGVGSQLDTLLADESGAN